MSKCGSPCCRMGLSRSRSRLIRTKPSRSRRRSPTSSSRKALQTTCWSGARSTAGDAERGGVGELKPRALLVRQLASALRLLIEFADQSGQPDRRRRSRRNLARARRDRDRSAHQKMTFDGVNLSFDKRSGATTFNLSVDGPNGRWSASGLASGAPHAERRLTLSLQNLSLDEILLATGARSIDAISTSRYRRSSASAGAPTGCCRKPSARSISARLFSLGRSQGRNP